MGKDAFYLFFAFSLPFLPQIKAMAAVAGRYHKKVACPTVASSKLPSLSID
jgi:hypothetical protein